MKAREVAAKLIHDNVDPKSEVHVVDTDGNLFPIESIDVDDQGRVIIRVIS